ncbi:DUF5719 family protein [Microbacterium amylolyticum]|uniref:Large extracellular alpha-helical protein n=1 Tax=Microbacterium amylolyticum TaxID=936337 RepID=A0ABS4ZKN2_9MICO|nr:DUF5719 family protein [Microbacterium amylolyticum]MBP2437583.1 hypothetical protein [Microbacterium amylolyticum]
MKRTLTRRIAGTTFGLALTAAVVGAAVLPWPDITAAGVGNTTEAPHTIVTPVPGEALLACDGPILALGRDASDAQGLMAVTDPAIAALNARSEAPDTDGRTTIDGVGEATTIVQLPDGTDPIAVSGAGSALLNEPDITGFAASACRAPTPEAWLVGATVATGITDIVVVANPSEVAATVSLEVFGVDGRTRPPGGEFALPAGAARAIPVASISGAEQSPVVRVIASGAPVRASLQSSRVMTLDPVGVDVQAAAAPATSAVIPRLTITESAAESPDEPTALRLLSIEGVDAVADVTVVSESSGGVAFSATLELAADQPLSVDLADLAAGSYTVRVDAESPIVAAVRNVAGADYGWSVAAPELDETSLVTLPDAPEGQFQVAIANTGDEPVTVVVDRLDRDVSTRTLDIGVGRSASFRAFSEGTYRIDVSDGTVAASASHVVDGAIASFPVQPDPAEPEPVTVFH